MIIDFLICFNFFHFQPFNDIIQQVTHSRIAQTQEFGHVLDASAVFDELQDELLVVGRKTRQYRQFV